MQMEVQSKLYLQVEVTLLLFVLLLSLLLPLFSDCCLRKIGSYRMWFWLAIERDSIVLVLFVNAFDLALFPLANEPCAPSS